MLVRHIHSSTSPITLNPLGQEDMTYLLQDPNFPTMMLEYMAKRTNGILEYIVDKHIRSHETKNRNMQKRDLKDDTIQIYNGSRWEKSPSLDVLDRVLPACACEFQIAINKLIDGANGVCQDSRPIILAFIRSVGHLLDIKLDRSEKPCAIKSDAVYSREQIARTLAKYAYLETLRQKHK